MDHTLKIAAIFVLLLLSGFFSSSETAFFSLSAVRIRRRKIRRDPRFKYIMRLLKSPNNFLSTVLIGNEMVNISISVVAATLVYSIARDRFSDRAMPFVSIAATVPLLLLFGEIIPKTIAVRFPEQVARANALLLYMFYRSVTPVRAVLNALSKTFISLLVKDPTRHPVDGLAIDEDTFKSMVEVGSREGTIEPDERDLIYRTFRLDDIPVSRIMTPRERIVAVTADSTREGFRTLALQEKYSRYPVYEQTIDRIVGFVHAKDLLRQDSRLDKKSDKCLRGLLRKPTCIPAARNALAAFMQLKKEKTHIAIVIGREGTTAGIITMEDILEELFGDIRDETDMEDPANE